MACVLVKFVVVTKHVPTRNNTLSPFELPVVVSCHSSWKNKYSLVKVIAAGDHVVVPIPLTSAVVLKVTAVPTSEPEVSSRTPLLPSAEVEAHTRMLRWPTQPAVDARSISDSVQAPAKKVPLYGSAVEKVSPAVVMPLPVPTLGPLAPEMNDVDCPVAVATAVAPKRAR